MWFLGLKGPSGFSASSTAEQVTEGVDGNGLTAIITGAASGIGLETTRVLALRGVHVIMAVRNVEAGRKAKEEILEQIPSAKVEVMRLDLSSMDSVRKFASEYTSLNLPLNLLINNAGVMASPFSLSVDHIEMQFATNHIVLNITRQKQLQDIFFLTNLLLENMKRTASESGKEGRIVNLSSKGHQWTYPGGIRFDKINEASGYKEWSAYGQSKLANILHANELGRRFKDEGVNITANSVHPGVIATNLYRHHGAVSGVMNKLSALFLKNVPQGAATTCYVALNPQVKGVTGEYFVDSNKAKPSALAKDEELAKKLWDFSLSFTNP